jgi:sec-independent protein translocase protein TatB
MEFLGISFWEFLLIMVVIVVVLGPAKIPGIMRTAGTIVRKFRKITSELQTSIAREIALDSARKEAEAAPPEGKKPKTAPPKSSRGSVPASRSKSDEH